MIAKGDALSPKQSKQLQVLLAELYPGEGRSGANSAPGLMLCSHSGGESGNSDRGRMTSESHEL